MTDDDFDLPDVDYERPVEEIHGGHGAAALERANWHLRHIAAIDRRSAIDEQVYRTELERIERWGATRKAHWDAKRAWHTKPCVDLLAAIRATDPRTKTLDLPAGRIKSRAGGAPRIVIDDGGALYEWAIHNRRELIRLASSVRASDLRDHCDILITTEATKVLDSTTGEVVPGVRVEIPDVTYSVDTSTEEF